MEKMEYGISSVALKMAPGRAKNIVMKNEVLQRAAWKASNYLEALIISRSVVAMPNSSAQRMRMKQGV